MTRTIKSILALTVFAFVATGCDQNAFEEDYPDPETEGIGPYVAFDAIGFQSSFSGAFNAATPAKGVIIPVSQARTPAQVAAGNLVRTFELEVRIPAAIGEDVTITYSLSGDAVRGEDYEIVGQSGSQGQLVLEFDEDNSSAEDSYRKDIVVNTFPAPAGAATQELTLTITGVSTASGREFTIGRIPDGRDRSVTLRFTPPA